MRIQDKIREIENYLSELASVVPEQYNDFGSWKALLSRDFKTEVGEVFGNGV